MELLAEVLPAGSPLQTPHRMAEPAGISPPTPIAAAVPAARLELQERPEPTARPTAARAAAGLVRTLPTLVRLVVPVALLEAAAEVALRLSVALLPVPAVPAVAAKCASSGGKEQQHESPHHPERRDRQHHRG